MGVDLGQAADLSLGDILSPEACVGDVEALLGCQTVDLSRLLPLLGDLQRQVGDSQPALVSDVLPERQGTISLEPWGYRDGGELLGQLFMFPSLSKLEPSSSKPCVISCPMTTPIAP